MTVQIATAEQDREYVCRPQKGILESMLQLGYFRYSQSTKWKPALNVYEDDESFYLCVELPGLTREQIHLEVIENTVRIKGERPLPPPPETATTACLLRMEIDSGPFERTLEMPPAADLSTIEAKLVNGFLWITMSKRES